MFTGEKLLIEIEFLQVTEGHVHKRLILQIKNSFRKDLGYSVLMSIFRVKKWIFIRVLSVKAKMSSIEM